MLEAFKEADELGSSPLAGEDDGFSHDFDPFSDKSDLSQEELKKEWEMAEKPSLRQMSHWKNKIDEIEKRIASGNQTITDKVDLKHYKNLLTKYIKNREGE